MKHSTSAVALLLRQHRELCGFSVSYVVDTLKSKYGISISEKTLYGYENGVSSPNVTTFIALCTIYGVNSLSAVVGSDAPLTIACGEDSWSADDYNDFFNANLLEKVYLLLRNGIPDFAGYMEQLNDSLPDHADAANYDRLFHLFKALRDDQHDAAFFTLEQLAADHHPGITYLDHQFLSKFRPYLEKLNDAGISKLLEQAAILAGNPEYTASSPLLSSDTGTQTG